MASRGFDSPLETPNQAAASPSLRGGFDYLFEDDDTIGDLFGNYEEESLFVDDLERHAAVYFDQETLIVDCGLSPVKNAVKERVKDAQLETKGVPIMKKGIARKVTKHAAKPSSYWVSETESEEESDPFAALKIKRTSSRNKIKKDPSHSSSKERGEEADDSLCESLKEQHARCKNGDEDNLKADSLADRIKRSRRHSRAISSKEKIILEVRDYKLSQKEKGKDNTINSDHHHTRHSKRNDNRMRNSSMANTHSSTTAHTAANQPIIILSDFASPEKRKRGASEQHRTTRKSSGPRPKRTCAMMATKDVRVITSVSVGRAKDGHQAAGSSKQPLLKATSTADAIAAERSEDLRKPKFMFMNPAFRPRLPDEKVNKTTSASKALSQPKVSTRVRKDSGADMSPTNAGISTGGEHVSRMDHVDMFEKQNGKNTRVLAGSRRGVAAVFDGGFVNIRRVSSARSDVAIDWTAEEPAALGIIPLRMPILSPKRRKTMSFNVPGVYKLQLQEATSGIQSLVDNGSEVPELSENKSTSEADTWIETPGHTSEDGTSANSQSAQEGPPANPQSVLTTEDAHAAVILAHLAYRDVLGQRERADIVEQAFNDAVQRIVMPRRWVFMNGALDGITDTTPSNQLLTILESEVALIEAQYNIQRSRSQHFTPAHGIFWNQVLLPIKRFLSNYRTANIVITRNIAQTLLLALSRDELVSQLDMAAQENLQDSNREVIAAMGLLAMRKMA